MNDRIPFNIWSKDRIARGLKKCTARHKKYSNDSRVTYITPKLPWWLIKTYLWKPEGAHSPAELQDTIEAIYGRPVPDDEMFYVHFGDFKEPKPKMYVIRSMNNNSLAWSNKHGWVSNETYDLFNEEEHDSLNLPIDGRWVQLD